MVSSNKFLDANERGEMNKKGIVRSRTRKAVAVRERIRIEVTGVEYKFAIVVLKRTRTWATMAVDFTLRNVTDKL